MRNKNGEMQKLASLKHLHLFFPFLLRTIGSVTCELRSAAHRIVDLAVVSMVFNLTNFKDDLHSSAFFEVFMYYHPHSI